VKQGPREALACDNAWSRLWGQGAYPTATASPQKWDKQRWGLWGLWGQGPIPALAGWRGSRAGAYSVQGGRARCRLAGGRAAAALVGGGQHNSSGHQQRSRHREGGKVPAAVCRDILPLACLHPRCHPRSGLHAPPIIFQITPGMLSMDKQLAGAEVPATIQGGAANGGG